ncbi:MAG: hypothetical protein CTY19_09985 [Methylomonas sp.]|nr:MAG: hypothetical protein CTY19_09985 [Methylomonas sp.]
MRKFCLGFYRINLPPHGQGIFLQMITIYRNKDRKTQFNEPHLKNWRYFMKQLGLISLLLLGLSGQVAAMPIISLIPDSTKIHSGENLYIDVNVSGLQSGGSNSLLGAFSMDVLFNPQLQFHPAGSGVYTWGFGLGDVDAGEALVGDDISQIGSGLFSFNKVSLLDTVELSALQSDSFRLATLAFYLPYGHTLASGSSINFSTANVVLSDDFGNELITGVNPEATVKIPEPPVVLLLGIGLIFLFFCTPPRLETNNKNYRTIRKLFNNLLLFWGIAGSGFATAQAQLSWKFNTIAEIGDTASDDGLASIRPSLHNGKIAFKSRFPRFGSILPSLYPGIYLGDSSNLIPIVGSPDNSGYFSDVSEPYLENGQVAYVGTINEYIPNIQNHNGIFLWNGQDIDTIVDTGVPIPGGSGSFSSFSGASLSKGQIVFNGSGVSDQQGIYRSNTSIPRTLDVIANAETIIPRTIVPPLPPQYDSRFTSFGLFPSIDGDSIAFIGFGPSLGILSYQGGVYTYKGGALKAVADAFTPVPGRVPTINFNYYSFQYSPAIHRGKVAFNTYGNDFQGIYTGDAPNTLEKVVDSSTLMPDGTSLFGNFSYFPAINHANVAFSADAAVTRDNPGIYLSLAGSQRETVKVFDKRNLPNGSIIMGLDLFHDAIDGNSVAFAVDLRTDPNNSSSAKTNIIRADLVGFSYPDFSGSDQLKLNGAAQRSNNLIQLTPDLDSQSGSAFFPMPFNLGPNSTFHTHFTFQIGGSRPNNGATDNENGADGLAFVIHNDPRGASAVGNSGEGLGFGINNSNGNPVSPISPSVAIEFDTFQGARDLDGNHVGLILNVKVDQHQALNRPEFLLNNGASRYVWIDYIGVSKSLKVYISTADSKPAIPAISTTVDLASQFGKEAFFGFTAGTGARFNSHDILAWKLDVLSSPSVGDFNGDSCVDQSDLSTLMAVVTKSGSKPLVYDLNGDGKVNIADSRKLVTLFTKPRGAACN